MGTDLLLHGQKVDSIFQLLGSKENDMTYSLGWALAQCPGLLRSMLHALFPEETVLQIDEVLLQEHSEDRGFTDIELLGPRVHVIVEAKRGWVLPTRRQLSSYTPRFHRDRGRLVVLATMSECTSEYAGLHLDKSVDGCAGSPSLLERSPETLPDSARHARGETSSSRVPNLPGASC